VRPRKRAAAAIKPPESETSVIPTCFPAKEESTANEAGKADGVDDKGEGDGLGEAAAATTDPADGAVDAPSKTNKWYNNAVLDHLCDLERGHHVGNVYMLFQGDITPQMRAILVDWLVEVNTEYQFSQQTLHLTVVLLDRYLSRMPVKRLKLQLVGITCMLIACKFEEICIPSLDSFIQISDFTFTREEILRMEAVVLLKLDFAIAAATASSFLSRYIAAAALEGVTVDGQIEHLSHFLCELALQDYACLRFMPSAIAAAAICLAHICVASPPHWSGQIAKCTQYSSEELRPCVLEMHALFRRSATSNLIATQSKYASPHRLEVSRITPPPVLPPF